MRTPSRVLWCVVVASGAACVLPACTTGTRGNRRPRGLDDAAVASRTPGEPPPAVPTRPPRIEGSPSLRVVWEALAVEIEGAKSSRFQRDVSRFGPPDLEVQLLNASFEPTPEQNREMRTQRAAGRTARVSDREMNELLRELEKLGFFRYARPTEAVRPFFASDRARGRITVERDGHSVTLVSQRGLGLNEATKEIPGIYAQSKYAIQLLKNRSPSLTVTGAKIDAADPDAMRRSGAASSPAGGGSGGGDGGAAPVGPQR